MFKKFFVNLWQGIKNVFTPSKPSNKPDNEEVEPNEPSNPPTIELPTPPVTVGVFNPKPNRDPNKPVVGVDIYWGDNVTDWKKLAEVADFVIIKASEHTSRKDPKFDEYRRKAKEVGLLVGFYHFFRTNKDPIQQANWFCDIIGKMQVGELCIVCDYETEDDSGDGFDILEVEKFNLQLEKRLGMIPWLYSGHILKQSGTAYKVPARMVRYPLWLAHYTSASRPVVPAPWTKETVWQWTESANIPGISNPKGTDFNRFQGTYQDLLKLAYQPKE